jgi:hypothetical protein
MIACMEMRLRPARLRPARLRPMRLRPARLRPARRAGPTTDTRRLSASPLDGAARRPGETARAVTALPNGSQIASTMQRRPESG